MKMFLTRLGDELARRHHRRPDAGRSPAGDEGGLVHALEVLEGVDGIGVVRFTHADVVRHPLVERDRRRVRARGRAAACRGSRRPTNEADRERSRPRSHGRRDRRPGHHRSAARAAAEDSIVRTDPPPLRVGSQPPCPAPVDRGRRLGGARDEHRAAHDPDLEVGAVAQHDVLATRTFSYVDWAATEARLRAAEDSVPPVYHYDRGQSVRIQQNVADAFAAARRQYGDALLAARAANQKAPSPRCAAGDLPRVRPANRARRRRHDARAARGPRLVDEHRGAHASAARAVARQVHRRGSLRPADARAAAHRDRGRRRRRAASRRSTTTRASSTRTTRARRSASRRSTSLGREGRSARRGRPRARSGAPQPHLRSGAHGGEEARGAGRGRAGRQPGAAGHDARAQGRRRHASTTSTCSRASRNPRASSAARASSWHSLRSTGSCIFALYQFATGFIRKFARRTFELQALVALRNPRARAHASDPRAELPRRTRDRRRDRSLGALVPGADRGRRDARAHPHEQRDRARVHHRRRRARRRDDGRPRAVLALLRGRGRHGVGKHGAHARAGERAARGTPDGVDVGGDGDAARARPRRAHRWRGGAAHAGALGHGCGVHRRSRLRDPRAGLRPALRGPRVHDGLQAPRAREPESPAASQPDAPRTGDLPPLGDRRARSPRRRRKRSAATRCSRACAATSTTSGRRCSRSTTSRTSATRPTATTASCRGSPRG